MFVVVVVVGGVVGGAVVGDIASSAVLIHGTYHGTSYILYSFSSFLHSEAFLEWRCRGQCCFISFNLMPRGVVMDTI